MNGSMYAGMYEQEIRWYALLPVSIVIGLFSVGAEVIGVWGVFPARPEWLWALALMAGLNAPPLPALAAFAWCGFVYDCMVGARLGAGSLAFVAVGWTALYWSPLAAARGALGQAALAAGGAFAAAVLRTGLEYGGLAYPLAERALFLSIANAALTASAYLPLAALLSFPEFCPSRERGRF